jgi:hypothetical protein
MCVLYIKWIVGAISGYDFGTPYGFGFYGGCFAVEVTPSTKNRNKGDRYEDEVFLPYVYVSCYDKPEIYGICFLPRLCFLWRCCAIRFM